MPSRLHPALLLLAFGLLAAGGCTVSNVQGPQLRDVPEGFGFDDDASSNRRALPGREILSRRGYYFRSDGGNASIVLTELAGPTEDAEVEEAYRKLEESWSRSGSIFGGLETVYCDDQRSWAWIERQERSRRFVVIVPYEDVTWTVDFYSSVRGEHDEDFMRAHALSFGRDPRGEEAKSARLGLGLVIGALILVIWWLRRQRRYRRRLKR